MMGLFLEFTYSTAMPAMHYLKFDFKTCLMSDLRAISLMSLRVSTAAKPVGAAGCAGGGEGIGIGV